MKIIVFQIEVTLVFKKYCHSYFMARIKNFVLFLHFIIQLEERTLSGSEIRWLACYFASSWLTNFGHGLVVTVVGPTQLYSKFLLRFIKVYQFSIQQIVILSFLTNYFSCTKCWSCKRYHQFALDIWIFWISCRFISNRLHIQKVNFSLFVTYKSEFSCILTMKHLPLKDLMHFRYFKTQMAKTCFLCVTMMINGLMMIVLPFLRNFGLLITCRCLQNLALGAFITADCRYDKN